MNQSSVNRSDIQGYSQLVIDATVGITSLVESMHCTVLQLPLPLGKAFGTTPSGIHGLVYRILQGSSGPIYDSIRDLAALIGVLLNEALAHTTSMPQDSSRGREAMLSIINGVLGDHMSARNNPMTIAMSFRQDGKMLATTPEALAEAFPQASGKVLVLLHGHCMNELQWCRNGHNHGEVLAAAQGYTPVYLRYNSGLHISDNGQAFSAQLEELVRHWPVPVEELCILGYSMGGLVARSAFHYGEKANHRWPKQVRKLLFVGTPHHGSMLEQAGNMLDQALEISPYSRALSRVGKIRSAGTTDLRHGSLIEEDWMGQNRFAHREDKRQVSQLPSGVECYAISAMIAKAYSEFQGQLVGDGLVPVNSALGKHRDERRALNFPEGRQRLFCGMNHMQLLDSQEVCAQLQQWLED